MLGFMQFLTGVYLLIGLTWFNVFGDVAPLYMAGLAFTAYGIHWFAMAHRRYVDASARRFVSVIIPGRSKFRGITSLQKKTTALREFGIGDARDAIDVFPVGLRQ
jgi:hypothetical protein